MIDSLSGRLRASPAFGFALMPDGRPFVAEATEPYRQFWLDERERRLLSAFSGRRGSAVSAVLRQLGGSPTEQQRLQRALRGLREAGVLVDPGDEGSRYRRRDVDDYLTHRPFPPEITARIVQRSHLQAPQRVLDLAGGPGDLALQLARHTPDVSLMDWSGAFLAAARARARAAGLPLRTLHESANRLAFDDARYEVVTVSQALHWLDDLAVCRGVARVLAPGGHFFVVHSAFEVPAAHPLATVLGHDSVLGAKQPVPFGQEVKALQQRVGLLLQAVQSRGVDRVDPLRASTEADAEPLRSQGVERFHQRRTLGLGFLQGLLTDRHLADAGLDPVRFWADAQARCAAATTRQLQGTHHWALLHFARAPAAGGRAGRAVVQAIGCSAPDV